MIIKSTFIATAVAAGALFFGGTTESEARPHGYGHYNSHHYRGHYQRPYYPSHRSSYYRGHYKSNYKSGYYRRPSYRRSSCRY